MDHSEEREAFLRIKAARETKKIPKDDGLKPSAIKKSSQEVARLAEIAQEAKEAKIAKKKLKEANKGSINSGNMLYHEDEKCIYQYYRSRFYNKVLAEKTEINIADELIIDLLAYAIVRVFRKSRLESKFNRFMDRTAPQDPVAQILSCIKSLGLKNNLKGNETTKDALGKLLGNDAADMGTNETITFEQWRESEKAKGHMKIIRRADTEFAVNEAYYKTPSADDDDEEDTEVNDMMPNFKL